MPTASLVSASVASPSTTTIHQDPNTNGSVTVVTGSSITVRKKRIENTASGNAKCFFKGYQNGAATVGVTAPNIVLPIKAGRILEVSVHGGLVFTALSFGCVANKAAADTTNPSGAINTYLGAS